MATNDPSVSIGDVSHSTFAIGAHSHAESHHGTTATPGDQELLAAVRELRADLARVRATAQTAELDAALADTEGEIARTGQATPTRRERLRELLGDSQALLGVLASAATLAGLVGL
ncbi:hypothetical protein NX794_26665 [Streptomyces sp. LP11]|uniref:Uncharacterized protein n=1 Tax=Streptomyces pyxinicus TaxID=2970331 RepID=A0ABT2B8P8_9ACTN|nr:hypothetical protein [Streptomyces sp. LP11]MCS0604771.1 hypothetical protein [Streptomyces sp. LP11]